MFQSIKSKITETFKSPLKYLQSPTNPKQNRSTSCIIDTSEREEEGKGEGKEEEEIKSDECERNVEQCKEKKSLSQSLDDEELVIDQDDTMLPYSSNDNITENNNLSSDNNGNDNQDNEDNDLDDDNADNADVEEEEEEEDRIDDDELQAFLLRAKLSDMKFTYIWGVMPDLGWKYNGAEYVTPDGINLGNSRIAMEALDVYALSPLTMRDFDNRPTCTANRIYSEGLLEEIMIQNPNMTCDDYTDRERRLKEARKQLLMKIFTKLDPESRRFELDYDDENDEYDEGVIVMRNGKEKKMKQKKTLLQQQSLTDIDTQHTRISKKRKSQQQNDNNYVSVTINEPGTEQYLARKSRRLDNKDSMFQILQKNIDSSHSKQKHQQPQEQISKHQDDEHQQPYSQPEKLTWPQPKENVEFIRRMRNVNDKDLDTKIAQISHTFLQDNISQWKFLLSTNHSLLFHGFGSKRILLNQFASELRSCGDVLTLDGHDSDINISSILDVIVVSFFRKFFYFC